MSALAVVATSPNVVDSMVLWGEGGRMLLCRVLVLIGTGFPLFLGDQSGGGDGVVARCWVEEREGGEDLDGAG